MFTNALVDAPNNYGKTRGLVSLSSRALKAKSLKILAKATKPCILEPRGPSGNSPSERDSPMGTYQQPYTPQTPLYKCLYLYVSVICLFIYSFMYYLCLHLYLYLYRRRSRCRDQVPKSWGIASSNALLILVHEPSIPGRSAAS